MDVYLQHRSITELPFYNCSSLSKEDLASINAIRHPLRGITGFIIGFPMTIIYILCLRVMLQPAIIRKSCYKIMFVVGLYDIGVIILNNFIICYSLTFGLAFCDAPNLFYTIGSLHIMSWTGVCYFCLYLAFNRILEALKLRRETIDFFFSPYRTMIGCLIGFLYSLYGCFFNSPVVYSNVEATPVPNPLDMEFPPGFELRETFLIANNYGVVVITTVLYGLFCAIMYKKIKKLGVKDSHNRLQHQLFIQTTLMCGFNFICSVTYASVLFLDDFIIVTKIAFFIYQFTSGLQALIYLICNQTILNGVKDIIYPLLKIERKQGLDMRTKVEKTNESSQPAVHVISVMESKPRLT
ncbi:unnamed protein product [Auanema sp. JU1783]|nr:unnamed protein product [Auanema sp. JU1783]